MRILLINPPLPLAEWPTIPIGLSYVAAVLEKAGVEVRVLDFLVNRYSEKDLQRSLADFKPDMVGITAVTMTYPKSSAILRACKEFDDNVTTIIGGPHTTFAIEETLVEAPWIDIIVRREGEQAMLEIANGKNLEEIAGIAFRKDGRTVMTGESPWIENLDELPLPARHLFPLSKHQALSGRCSLISARGCPFNCIFCLGHKMVGRRPRLRSPQSVVDEMVQIQELGFSEVCFDDDLLTMNHAHLHAVCDEIHSRGLKIKWGAFSRVDTINREMMEAMKEAGCSSIVFGVESGNQEILDRARKRITLDQARAAITLAKDLELAICASFIVGLPGETRETMWQTYDFAKELGVPYGLHVIAPFIGTELREKADEYGIRILTNDWAKYDANRSVCVTEEVGPKEVAEVQGRYFSDLNGYLRYRAQREKENKLTDEERSQINGERHRKFVWRLLKNDCIENLGPVQIGGDPAKNLAQKLADVLDFPVSQTEESTCRLVSENLLTSRPLGEDTVWNWR